MLLREWRWNLVTVQPEALWGERRWRSQAGCAPQGSQLLLDVPRLPSQAAPRAGLGEGGPSVPEPVAFLKMSHHLQYMVCPMPWAGCVLPFSVTLLIVNR